MAGRVEGKVALVTGGAMGLGKADCERLAAEGAKIVVTDINEEEGQKVAAAVGGHFLQHDVRDEARWQEIFAEVEKMHGRLDILVNNAGNVIFEDILECSLDHFRLHLDIHVVGTFLGCKYGIPLMAKSGGGSIINMASTASLLGYGNIPAYTAAKGAIRSMTKSIAMYCQDEDNKIRVNVLMPGGIETPMVMGISGRAGEEPMDIPDGVLPKDSLGAPEDVANMVLFLASDESRFQTGNEYTIDNGLKARPER
ncbi:SDR family oxidoreductase [Parerythrobacter jejuensis]|uniref:SDR family oxidoreductase n=1 Tax=Parerythrobacter jejuensis TaxID=795812 RepID=A0A845AUU6_9SPHN|nr:SDR family oxidoreductase [Parerythrobacter jejuensis]MXP30203.1 SDR family oxidoreductase [Parerythrobacter jejuensis]MXP32963.1 SDR family oxidoreductase [Parerythrobacter jejuensis]